MTIGIYLLRFNGTHKVYVGQSINIEKRYTDHLYVLKRGLGTYKMQAAYKKYGIPILEILCQCSIEELDNTEKEAIEIFDSVDKGYNILYFSQDHLRGEDNGNALYTNSQIESVFLHLTQENYIPYKEIAALYGVSVYIVAKIAEGTVHVWLKEKYPEKYAFLQKLKGSRNSGENHYNSKASNEDIERCFLFIIENPQFTLKQVSEQTNIPYTIVDGLCKLQNHKWLKSKYPQEYTILQNRLGSRRKGATISTLGREYPTIFSPEGIEYSINNAAQFAREHNLDSSCLIKVLKGIRPNHKGWKINKII